MTSEERLKEIDKKIFLQQFFDAPGTIMVGLGLYAKFAANGNAFLPLLNNPNVVNGMLVMGVTIMAWGGYKVLTLVLEKARIKNEHNL
ncbi:MAG: hypothetical protein ACRBCI_13840 [Cellvibrionaceae bacterium]